jgi:hypothetical protein
MDYYKKYLKYKNKYLELKIQIGAGDKFIKAIKDGDYNTVIKKLTEKHGLINAHYSDCNQIECKTGYTPFLIAWNQKNFKMAKLLIKYGADVNVINPHTKQLPLEDLLIKLGNDSLYPLPNLQDVDEYLNKDVQLLLKENKNKILELLDWIKIIMEANGKLKVIYVKNKLQTIPLKNGLYKLDKIIFNLVKNFNDHRGWTMEHFHKTSDYLDDIFKGINKEKN